MVRHSKRSSMPSRPPVPPVSQPYPSAAKPHNRFNRREDEGRKGRRENSEIKFKEKRK
ncbi:hypothetical protein SESBI_02631 [Sesbania bispinosa]|nr:hypothetical protein SESBI_02631 [Sesbania bispinosa]